MNVVDTASQLTSKLSDIVDTVQTVSKLAGKTIEDRRGDTAATLHSAASVLRTTGEQVRDTIENLVTGVANGLETAASYIESFDVRGRKHKANGQILMAGGIALLVGFAMWRLTRSTTRA